MRCGRMEIVALMATVAVMTGSSGAAAQDPERVPAEPTPFSATWSPLQTDPSDGWAYEGIDPHHDINGEWQFEVTATTDPRLVGTVRYAYNNDIYKALDLEVHRATFRLEGESGAWQGTPGLTLGHPDFSPSTRTDALVGEGDYEGLTAVAEITWDPSSLSWQVSGYVLDGPIPPLPGEGEFPE